MKESLQHIAFIMDGNRRWAAAHNVSILSGYSKGYDTAKFIVQLLSKYGIKYATLYMFSTENWGRSKEEVDYLMGMLCDAFSDVDGFLMKNNIKVTVIGDFKTLPRNEKNSSLD